MRTKPVKRAEVEAELLAALRGANRQLSPAAKDLCLAHHSEQAALIALKLFEAALYGHRPVPLPGAPGALLHIENPWAPPGEILGVVVLSMEEYGTRMREMADAWLTLLGLQAPKPWYRSPINLTLMEKTLYPPGSIVDA